MIAPVYVQPRRRPNAPARPGSQHNAQEATKRRKAAQLKRRYRDCVSIGLISTAIVFCVVGYLALITRSTTLDDRLMTAQAQHAKLQEELLMLEDRHAALEARDRLSQIAFKLGFKEHAAMLIVNAPLVTVPATPSSPLMGAVAGLLHLQ